MSEEALQACVDRHLELAAMVFVLDEELGTHHGLSWADFVLLTVLDDREPRYTFVTRRSN